MTAVWDEVVEYEVIELGIQCNAMFYSLSDCCKALFWRGVLPYQWNIHCSLCVHYLEHRILPYLL